MKLKDYFYFRFSSIYLFIWLLIKGKINWSGIYLKMKCVRQYNCSNANTHHRYWKVLMTMTAIADDDSHDDDDEAL